ncbi:uncharacterized protein LOC143750694 [Siphateles boraxobius]|uniref:uncharacterized protein LOC143750694 n=1 Tax=Siphateles boraxobius TaxID=180520 RepID=UPI004062AF69
MQEVTSFTSDMMLSDSVSIVELTDEAKPVVLSAWSSERDMKASPAGTFSPTEKPASDRESRAIREIFRRFSAVVKQPFLCCDPDSVQPLTPQPDTVPGPSRTRPAANTSHTVRELVCLPGQVCEDLPLLQMCVPGSTGIESPVPDSPCSDLPNE